MNRNDVLKDVEATSEIASKIQAINKDTVHRICSGQVVLSLAIAVKELLENALDAGATVIEIRLKEYGQELIEVQDNGFGVTEENFSGLTLKYYTSKLKEFSDLLGMSTFGFRGEALSSLCALSNLTITTRHRTVDYGTKITYDSKGHIKETVPCARQVGTTVSLANLFYTLPVRQKEFHKNIKREFNKMTQLLYAYCLVSESVKILCTNHTAKGSKTTVVATQGGSVRDNIGCVFGVKQLQTLLTLNPVYPEDDVTDIKQKIYSDLEINKINENFATNEKIDVDDIKSDTELDLSEDSSNDAVDKNTNVQESGCNSKTLIIQNEISSTSKNKKRFIEFDGLVSTCAHGNGRSTTERQFFYVNSRPCEPQKITKIVNEVYKQYNPHQYPFVYLNVKVEKSSVDVNVTPDKRKVFLDKENYLLKVIKASLQKIYENIPSTLKMENLKEEMLSQKFKNDIEKPRVFSSFLNQFNNKLQKHESPIDKKPETKRKCENLDDFVSVKILKVEPSMVTVDSQEFMDMDFPVESNSVSTIENVVKKSNISENENDNKIKFELKDIQKTDSGIDVTDELKEAVCLGYTKELHLSQVLNLEDVLPNVNNKIKNDPQSIPKKQSPQKKSKTCDTNPIISDLNEINKNINTCNRKYRTVNITINDIKKNILEDTNSQFLQKKNIEKIKFRSEINPVFNKRCEEELQKEISKDMFSKMTIIGQFNLGFIVTKLDDDLFIIDQHATDEKYNFETLQKTTTLSNQKLVIPQSLDLTGVNERILLDNLEVFRKNGFTFEIDEQAPPTKRVKLLTIPLSHQYVFGKDDIEELLFMLKDAHQEICRPSRVQAMFASRACRKSVMIGTALNKAIMRKLVDHMGEIEHPWNCPHGRPTIRHLINLAMVEGKS